MFPIKTGLGNATTPDVESVFFQSLTCAALNEIAKQAIIDTSILLFHQLEVEIYYQTSNGNVIPEDADGKLIVYSPEQEKEIRRYLRDIVWKYHILDPNGLVSRLSPLIYYIQNQEPVPPAVISADPFLQNVLNTYQNYTQNVYHGNTHATMNQILNFDQVENISDAEYESLILASRNDGNELVSVAVYDDDTVQCGCDYCEGFFQIIDAEINYDNLNFLQNIMIKNFDLDKT